MNFVMLLSSHEDMVFELVLEEWAVLRKEYSLVGSDYSELCFDLLTGCMAMFFSTLLPLEQPVHLFPICQ